MNYTETSFSPDTADLYRISKAVIAFDRAYVGAASPQPLACLRRNNGLLIGGASGRIEMNRLFVEFLWVDAIHRRKGLGGRLLGDIENAAKDFGCTESQIESLSEETAFMYQRAGYKNVAQIENYIPGLTLHVLLKPL